MRRRIKTKVKTLVASSNYVKNYSIHNKKIKQEIRVPAKSFIVV